MAQTAVFPIIGGHKDKAQGEQTWVTDTKYKNIGLLAGNSLLFREVSLYCLEQCLSFLMPVFNSVNQHTSMPLVVLLIRGPRLLLKEFGLVLTVYFDFFQFSADR